MSNVYFSTLILFSALGSGLIAGIFFAFSTFVMAALARLAPAQGIAAMQAINETVLNPWFFTAFFGTAAGCIILVIVTYLNGGEPTGYYLVAGSLFYLVGCFLVTVLFNVPLNNALATVKPGSVEGAELWSGYLSRWTLWNHVRTIISLMAMASFILALG